MPGSDNYDDLIRELESTTGPATPPKKIAKRLKSKSPDSSISTGTDTDTDIDTDTHTHTEDHGPVASESTEPTVSEASILGRRSSKKTKSAKRATQAVTVPKPRPAKPCCNDPAPKPKQCCCVCAQCIVPSTNACRAPCLDALENIISTAPIAFPSSRAGTSLTADYFVRLPTNPCQEVRVIWRTFELRAPTPTTGINVSTVRLNIVSNGLNVVNPLRLQPLQNGNLTAENCECSGIGDVVFTATSTVPGTVAGVPIISLPPSVAPDVDTLTNTNGLHLSFVPSCDEGCKQYWLMQYLSPVAPQV